MTELATAGKTVTVCRSPHFPVRAITYCPTCKQRRRFAGSDGGAYYGVTWTCCTCGDSWSDGERASRPARRGWRTEAAAKAKDTWNEAGKYTRADWEKWLREQMEDHRPSATPA